MPWKDFSVAPYVGAWIETGRLSQAQQMPRSHPMWVRGLKRKVYQSGITIIGSHPMWVRGLKHQTNSAEDFAQRRTLCGCVD